MIILDEVVLEIFDLVGNSEFPLFHSTTNFLFLFNNFPMLTAHVNIPANGAAAVTSVGSVIIQGEEVSVYQ